MKRFLTKYGIFALSLAAAITVILSLVTYFSSNTGALTNVVNVVTTPFRAASAQVTNWIDDKLRFAAEYDALKEENYQLKLQIAEMEEQLRQAQADSDENAILRQLLGLQEQRRDLTWASALIVQQDTSNWASTLTLNIGTDNHVSIGDCVINESGYLVGSITDVGTNWSSCTTLIDTDASFGAKVFRTGDVAVAQGEFALMGEGKLKLDYLSDYSALLAGDLIVTSGLGDYYPAGLVIGYVDEILTDADGVARYAILSPAAPLAELKQVFVVTDFTIVP